MKDPVRRTFLKNLGLTVGGLAFGKDIVGAAPSWFQEKSSKQPLPKPEPAPPNAIVDFRYAPKNWQSTYCFPDDPSKSLVGKNGELLCNHPGPNNAIDDFAETISIGMSNEGEGVFLEQMMESPGIPIVRT